MDDGKQDTEHERSAGHPAGAVAAYQRAERYVNGLIFGPPSPPPGTPPEEIRARAVARLTRLRAFLAFLGNPQRAYRTIHITGTSGKGSTTTFAASILTAAGYRVGTHVSPYLQVATEKLQIDGLLIPPVRYERLVDDMRRSVEEWVASGRERPNYGEFWVAMTLRYFAEERVDVAVVEVGAGGRFDVTNVIEPDVVAITSVGLDHTVTLGSTLPEIAWHKAGIIKPGSVAVTAVTSAEALPVIEEESRKSGAGLVVVREGAQYRDVVADADGTSFIAEYWSYPQIRDGKTVGAVVTFLDITERMRSEEILRESNERFSTAFNCAPVMMTISALENGVYLDVNQVFLEVSGFTREEVIGRTSVELGWIAEADRMQLKEQLLQDGNIRGMDLMLHAKSGRTVLCKYWGEIISAGGQRQLLSIALDVTEHRRVEQQLVQAQKMESVGRLAGGVAHDFNNMLSVILGHAELGLVRLDPAHPVAADLTQISKAAERSADLTRQLLAFASKQTIAPKVLDLNEVIAGMLKMLQRLIGEDIHIVWQPAPDLWQVRVDPSQVDQILANLFVNARDAITDIGRITITTENVVVDTEYDKQVDFVPGEYVKLTVSDNGSGMDRETLAHIFEPFFTTKGSGKGTGMGLATVFGAVTQNKGFIHVDSSPEQGTTFSIHLPRHVGEARQMPIMAATAPLQNGQETVLLVEDEPTILEMAATMLAGLGYVVLKAGSPDAAISLARNHSGEIDLLLTDVVMPGMNGRSLAAALLPLYPSMKQLFMSGYTADVIAPRGVLEEGVQYIQKPFAVAALAAKVREVLDARNY